LPTVHLSLPDRLYREIRQYAEEMGVQITDIIKYMIREGIEKYREEKRKREREEKATEALLQVLHEIDVLRKELREQQTFIEGELYRLSQVVQNIKKRISKLEDIVEDKIYPVETEIIPP